MAYSSSLRQQCTPRNKSFMTMPDRSMSPEIEEGSTLVLDDCTALCGDGIYAFGYAGAGHIARLQNCIDGTVKILLADSSQTHHGRRVQPGDLDIYGRITFAWRKI